MERASGWRRQRLGDELSARRAALVSRSAEAIGHTDEEAQLVKTEPRPACRFVPRRQEGWISWPQAGRSRGPIQVLVPVCGDDQGPARRHLEGGDQCAHIDNLTAFARAAPHSATWRAFLACAAYFSTRDAKTSAPSLPLGRRFVRAQSGDRASPAEPHLRIPGDSDGATGGQGGDGTNWLV